MNTGVTGVSVGANHVCASTTTGLKCWGGNKYGQVGNGQHGPSAADVGTATSVTPFAAAAKGVACGFYFSCGITSTNTVKCWGDKVGNNTQVDIPNATDVAGLTNIVSLSASESHMCARTQTGAVKCWGVNDGNQLGNGTQVNSTTPVNVLTLP